MSNKCSNIHDENVPFAVAFTPDRPPTKKTRRVLPKVNQALLEEQQWRVNISALQNSYCNVDLPVEGSDPKLIFCSQLNECS